MAGFDVELDEDIYDGKPGHAVLHVEEREQVNFITQQLDDLRAADSTSPLGIAVREIAPPVNAFQEAHLRAMTGAQDSAWMFVTDSTGTRDQNTWTTPIPAWAVTMYPHLTIKSRDWDYTSGTAWRDEVVHADRGAGAKVLYLYFGGAPNQNWQYFQDSARRAAFWAPPTSTAGVTASLDLVAVGLGHNDGTESTRRCMDRAKVHLGRWQTYQAHAHFVLMSQNPTTLRASGEKADGYRRIEAQTGIGYVDVYDWFLEYDGPITDLVPNGNLHPTALGYARWWLRIASEFDDSGVNRGRSMPQSRSSLITLGRSLLPRLTVPLTGWTHSNVTETNTAALVDRRASAVVLTKTSAGAGAFSWIPLPNEVRGKSIFIVAHVHIPAASYGAGTGQLQTRLGGNVRKSAIVPSGIRDQYFDLALSDDIPFDAAASPNGARIYLHTDAQAGSELPSIIVEDVNVFYGDYPLDAYWAS